MNRIALWILLLSALGRLHAAELIGRVTDFRTGEPLPCRIHLRDSNGVQHHVLPDEPEGTALPYREQWVRMPMIEDKHTTVSAHRFRANLKPGRYEIEIEHGKEYIPHFESLTLGTDQFLFHARLRRFVNLSERGWYSGETHVHRRIQELTNVMAAENLNVAFPVTFWTIHAEKAPDLSPSPLRSQGPSPFGPREDAGPDPFFVGRNRVVVPRNTEYEIFNVGGRPHTLGALFVLNHRTPLTDLVPPVKQLAQRVHAEGALLDLDKHSWPWAMMLVPIANVDLFELSNNSVWRTSFGFNQPPKDLPEWMKLERDSPTTLSEWGWLNFGFESYYALLNCGFPLAPTAGTASGVHPVPLGHSRVYVHTGPTFSLERWMHGLKLGRSFVTTGPMLFAKVNGKFPGETFRHPRAMAREFEIEIETLSEQPLESVEIVVRGEVGVRLTPSNQRTADGAWRSRLRRSITIDDTSWIAVRCAEPRSPGRKRFAHTAPWQIRMGDHPLNPSREQIDWLLSQVDRELQRNRGILPPESLAEFQEAKAFYESIQSRISR